MNISKEAKSIDQCGKNGSVYEAKVLQVYQIMLFLGLWVLLDTDGDNSGK